MCAGFWVSWSVTIERQSQAIIEIIDSVLCSLRSELTTGIQQTEDPDDDGDAIDLVPERRLKCRTKAAAAERPQVICSTSLDDEHSFVVNAVFLANLPEMIIVLRRVFQ